MKPAVIAVVSDTHIGGYTALSLHKWNCDTGLVNTDGTPMFHEYQATLAQDWIYDKWIGFWSHVKKLAGRKNRIVVFHLGDVIDGFHPRYIQAMSNVGDQKAMAVEILKPIEEMADQFYFIRGTECHIGLSAQHEVEIAGNLGIPCVWEGIFDVGGIILDLAHHGRVGMRKWTSAAAGIAVEAIHDAATDIPPRKIPHYVFRGHMHRVDDSGEKVSGTRAVCLPSWELKNALGHRLEAGKWVDIGGVIVLPDGSLDLSRLRHFSAPGQRKILEV